MSNAEIVKTVTSYEVRGRSFRSLIDARRYAGLLRVMEECQLEQKANGRTYFFNAQLVLDMIWDRYDEVYRILTGAK